MSEKCIYCDSGTEFNIEHMFPAGMGRDDRFVLKGCVCTACNSLFAKDIEVELMRRSPAAIARMFLQDHGREKDEPPKLEAEAFYTMDPERGLALESVAGKKMLPDLPPQAIINGKNVQFISTKMDDLQTFFNLLEELVEGEKLFTVKKIRDQDGSRFLVTEYVRTGDKYQIGESVEMKKLPKGQLLWLQQFSKPHQKGNAAFHPRFFLHDRRSINYKSDGLEELCLNLARMREFVRNRDKCTAYEDTEHQNPLVKVEMAFDIHKPQRAMAKIGVNTLAFLCGAKYIRDKAFDTIKSSILTGEPVLPLVAAEVDDPFQFVMGGKVDNSHVLCLHKYPLENGRCHIIFCIRLYGGHTYQFLLAENAPDAEIEPHGTYFVVNYVEHRIEQLSGYHFLLRELLPDIKR